MKVKITQTSSVKIKIINLSVITKDQLIYATV